MTYVVAVVVVLIVTVIAILCYVLYLRKCYHPPQLSPEVREQRGKHNVYNTDSLIVYMRGGT